MSPEERRELLRKADMALGLDKPTVPVAVGLTKDGKFIVEHMPTRDFLDMVAEKEPEQGEPT